MTNYCKVEKFQKLDLIINNNQFQRKPITPNVAIKGVYFWGFTLREDFGLPKKPEDILIYYIGKNETNVIERIMQELTQLIFGGFGPIFSKNYLENNAFSANLTYWNDQNILVPNPNILYKPDGLNVLYNFIINSRDPSHNLYRTLDWMKNRVIFTWIPLDTKQNIKDIEYYFHKTTVPNTLGLGHLKRFSHRASSLSIQNNILTANNNFIDFTDNPFLLEWFKKVNDNIREVKDKKNAIKNLANCNTGLNMSLINAWLANKYVPNPNIIQSLCVKPLLK